MSYQEKENVVNIFSGLAIGLFYGIAVYQRHLEGRFDLTQDYRQWAIIFLIFIGVSIVVRIIIYIIFHIINAIITREEEKIPVEDERAKLINLKATRNNHFTCTSVMMLSLCSLLLGWQPWVLILGILGGCLLGDVVDNLSQLYYHRRGI